MVSRRLLSVLGEAPNAASSQRRPGCTVEVAAMLLLGALLEHVVFGGGVGFVDVRPSPLLLVVLWAAMRAGTGAALVAAVAAGALHVLGLACVSGFDLGMVLEPAVGWPLTLFGVVALLFGQVRDGVQKDRVSAERRSAELQRDVDDHRHDVQLLHRVNRELKRRIFDRSYDFESLMLTVARHTGSADDKIFDVPLEMLHEFCGATKCSVLLLLPGELIDLAAHRGWTDQERQRRLDALRASERLQRAVARARPLVGLHDGTARPGEPLMVAPLADASGVVKAVLCIDEMPPQRYGQGAIRTFLGIATWVATNLRRREIGQTTDVSWQSVKQALEASKGIGSAVQLGERVFLEDARRSRYGVDTVMVALRLPEVVAGGEERVASVESAVQKVLAGSLRQTDDVYRFGFAGTYVLVLTGCQRSHGEAVLQRLREHFEASGESAMQRAELALFAVDDDHPSLASTLQTIGRFFFAEPGCTDPLRAPVPEPHAQRVGSDEDFVRRVRLEVELARRREWDLNIVDYQLAPEAAAEAVAVDVGPMIARHLSNHVGRTLRVTDGIYVLGPDRCVVLLPCTTCLDATRIWQRLQGDLAGSLPGDLFEKVSSEFLALADLDVKDVLVHLLGGDRIQQPAESVLNEEELQALSDAIAEISEGLPATSFGSEWQFEADDGTVRQRAEDAAAHEGAEQVAEQRSASVREALGWLDSFEEAEDAAAPPRAAEPAGEPATEPATAPACEPAGAPATQPAGEPAGAPISELAAEPATAPSTASVTEQATEQVAEPTTEPAAPKPAPPAPCELPAEELDDRVESLLRRLDDMQRLATELRAELDRRRGPQDQEAGT